MSEPSIEPLKEWSAMIPNATDDLSNRINQAIAAYDNKCAEMETALHVMDFGKYGRQHYVTQCVQLEAQVAALTEELDSRLGVSESLLENMTSQRDRLTKERDEACAALDSIRLACHLNGTTNEELVKQIQTIGNEWTSRVHALEQGVACASELLSQVHIVNDEPFPNRGVRVAIPDWFEKRRKLLAKIALTPLLTTPTKDETT